MDPWTILGWIMVALLAPALLPIVIILACVAVLIVVASVVGVLEVWAKRKP